MESVYRQIEVGGAVNYVALYTWNSRAKFLPLVHSCFIRMCYCADRGLSFEVCLLLCPHSKLSH